MPKPLVVANWKMNTTLPDALVLTNSVRNAAGDIDAEIVLCPPFIWLVPMAEELEHSSDNLHLGAQNMWFADSGAMTGEISPLMLKGLAKFVILGHSERRSHFGESNALINDKIHAALNHGLKPILCVSELQKYEEKHNRGRPTSADLKSDIFDQLRKGLAGVSEKDILKVAIAFEPVWAISTTPGGKGAASGVYAAEMIGLIRKIIAQKYDQDLAREVCILYGGSVDTSNVAEFLYQREINGVLVGGASLKAKDFIEICRRAAEGGD